jgi:hypothetical protein
MNGFINGYGHVNMAIKKKTLNINNSTSTLDMVSEGVNGEIEKIIGVIRRFFSKKIDLLLINKNDIKLEERKLNNRPVRKFNYLTPNEVLQQKIALIT